jgi:dipeptide/tripeptide permease
MFDFEMKAMEQQKQLFSIHLVQLNRDLSAWNPSSTNGMPPIFLMWLAAALDTLYGKLSAKQSSLSLKLSFAVRKLCCNYPHFASQ